MGFFFSLKQTLKPRPSVIVPGVVTPCGFTFHPEKLERIKKETHYMSNVPTPNQLRSELQNHIEKEVDAIIQTIQPTLRRVIREKSAQTEDIRLVSPAVLDAVFQALRKAGWAVENLGTTTKQIDARGETGTFQKLRISEKPPRSIKSYGFDK